MSKYQPLTDHLSRNRHQTVPMTFADIERVIARRLPPSSRSHRAWWSNNPTNNVMTKAWLAAGYETEQVDLAAERLVFRRRRNPNNPGQQSMSPNQKTSSAASSNERDFFGFMKGKLILADGFDPTLPTGEEWSAEVGEELS